MEYRRHGSKDDPSTAARSPAGAARARVADACLRAGGAGGGITARAAAGPARGGGRVCRRPHLLRRRSVLTPSRGPARVFGSQLAGRAHGAPRDRRRLQRVPGDAALLRRSVVRSKLTTPEARSQAMQQLLYLNTNNLSSLLAADRLGSSSARPTPRLRTSSRAPRSRRRAAPSRLRTRMCSCRTPDSRATSSSPCR